MKYFKLIVVCILNLAPVLTSTTKNCDDTACEHPGSGSQKVEKTSRAGDGSLKLTVNPILGGTLKKKPCHPLIRNRLLSNKTEVVVRRVSSYQSFADKDVVCELTDSQKDKLKQYNVVKDNTDKLFESLKHCDAFKYNDVLTDLMLDMIKYKSMFAFKLLFPRVKQNDDSLSFILFQRAIEYRNLQVCDFLLSQKIDIRRSFAEFWEENSEWSVFATKTLARHHPKRIFDMVPDPNLVKKAECTGTVSRMVDFIVYCKSLSRNLTKDQAYQFRVLMGIMKNKHLEGSKMAEFIRRITLNRLEGDGDDLFRQAIQSSDINVLKAILANKKLQGSAAVVEEAAQSWSTNFIGALLRDERFSGFIDYALLVAVRQEDPVVLEYLLKHDLGKIEFQKNPTLLKHLILAGLSYNHVNLADIFTYFPAEKIKAAISLEMAEGCVKQNAWVDLGILMSVQVSKPPILIPQLLLGLQLVLIANAEKQYPADLTALSPDVRIETVYKLGEVSKRVDAYLQSFWSAYDVLPEELRCNDWLMDLYQQRKLSKMDLFAIGKAITPVVSATSTPSDLLQIAQQAMIALHKQ
jgi:hypothetical protein